MTWAEHVGRTFKFFGARYRCTEYDPGKGLLMVLLDAKHEFNDRRRGHRTWVSERAIGRTYHMEFEIP